MGRLTPIADRDIAATRGHCCHPDRSEPTPFLRVRFWANASARAVEGPWREIQPKTDQNARSSTDLVGL